MRNWISSMAKDLLVVGSIKAHTVEDLNLNSKGGEIPLTDLGTCLGVVNVGTLTIGLTTGQAAFSQYLPEWLHFFTVDKVYYKKMTYGMAQQSFSIRMDKF